MKRILQKTLPGFAVACLMLVMTGVGATAATYSPCASETPNVTNEVTANIGCQVVFGITGSEAAGDLVGMFSQTTWSKLGRVNNPAGTDGPLSLTSNGVDNPLYKGKWAVTQAVLDSWNYVVLLFKAGQNSNTDPSAFVAYRINTKNGVYNSPLFQKNSNTRREISHVTLWVSDRKANVVPLPAGGLLLLSGLGGIVMLRRRKSS